MSLVLTEEQVAVQDAAKKLIRAQSPLTELRRLRDEKNPTGYCVDLWQRMIELGWPGIIIPETFGGLGLTADYLSVILEECGRTLTPSPVWSSGLFASYLIVNSNTSELQRETLTALAAGTRTVAVALEEKARHAPFDIKTTLSGTSQMKLNGRKHFVVNGHVADALVVTARSDEGALQLVLVNTAQSGVTVERNQMVDSHNSATITFNDVSIEPQQVLCSSNAEALLQAGLDVARLGLSAEMLGTASEAFDRTLAYLKEREQFGAIIGSFQALKHRAATMFVELELARSAVREGFSVLNSNEVNTTKLARLASIAKMQLCQTLHLISNEAVQLHGGIGMTDEHEIGFFLKRARVLEQLLGDDVYHIDRYASLSGY